MKNVIYNNIVFSMNTDQKITDIVMTMNKNKLLSNVNLSFILSIKGTPRQESTSP